MIWGYHYSWKHPYRFPNRILRLPSNFGKNKNKALQFPRKHMDVSENSGTPKSSILIGSSTIKHPFWGTTIFGNTYICPGIWDEFPAKKSTGRSPAPTPHRHLKVPAFWIDHNRVWGKIGKRIEIVTSNSNAVCTCYSMVTILGITTISQIYKNSTLSLAYTIMSFSWFIPLWFTWRPIFFPESKSGRLKPLGFHRKITSSWSLKIPMTSTITGHFFPQRTCQKKTYESNQSCNKNMFWYITHTIHVWNMYLHLVDVNGKCS